MSDLTLTKRVCTFRPMPDRGEGAPAKLFRIVLPDGASRAASGAVAAVYTGGWKNPIALFYFTVPCTVSRDMSAVFGQKADFDRFASPEATKRVSPALISSVTAGRRFGGPDPNACHASRDRDIPGHVPPPSRPVPPTTLQPGGDTPL